VHLSEIFDSCINIVKKDLETCGSTLSSICTICFTKFGGVKSCNTQNPNFGIHKYLSKTGELKNIETNKQ
jgi:hypothetical protein